MEGFTPEFALAFRELMVQSLAQELPVTSKVLASIPDIQRDYRPAPASRSAWELAWHIAADVWFLEGIANLRFETDPDLRHANPAQTATALAKWYKNEFTAALDKACAMKSQQLLTEVVLGGVAAEAGASFPAVLYLLFLEKHTIHHRGQLAAYLRPTGAKVPAIYGRSADEP